MSHRTSGELPVPIQCVGPSGNLFVACVAASSTEPHSTLFQGTFWYHSHFKNQYCDGLRGPLIIYDPEDPHQDLYDIDDGEVVFSAQLIIRLRHSLR